MKNARRISKGILKGHIRISKEKRKLKTLHLARSDVDESQPLGAAGTKHVLTREQHFDIIAYQEEALSTHISNGSLRSSTGLPSKSANNTQGSYK